MAKYSFNPFSGVLDETVNNTVADGLTGLTTIAAGSILAANTLDTLTAVTSTSGLKALQNNAGTITWNTATGTGNSVFATSPTFVTDLTTPLIYGGAAASGNLILQSTSNATRGFVQIPNTLKVYTDTDTLSTTPSVVNLLTGGANISTGGLVGLNLNPTITMTGNGSASGLMFLFNAGFTLTDDGTARSVQTSVLFVNQTIWQATLASGLTLNDLAGIPGVTGFYHAPKFTRTGAGTGTATTVCGFFVGGLAQINTGWTVTNYEGMELNVPSTLTGTMTNFYGIKNNVNSATSRWFLYSNGTAQNYLAGRLGIGITTPNSLLHVEGASGWIVQDEQDTNVTTSELDANDSIAIYNKANKFVIAYNNAGTITYVSIPLDGSTTTWTHSTVAP